MLLALLATATLLTPQADSLDLATALRRARAARPRTAEIRAQVAAARASLRIAGTIPNPTFAYSRSQSTPTDHFQLDQSFDWLLRRAPDRRAAQAELERAAADSVRSTAELASEVRSAFYTAIATREGESLVRAQAALADSVSLLAGLRLRAGEISLLEREQTDQEAARARRLVSSAREARAVAQLALARAVAWPVPELPPMQGSLADALDVLPDTATTVDMLPASRGAIADSIAAAERLRSANAGRIPLPSLTAGTERGDPSQTSPRAISTFGFAIPLPIWNVNGGSVAFAKASAAAESARLAEARLELGRQLAEQRVRLVEAAIRARFARDTLLPTAIRVRQRVVKGFAAGETGVLPVLDALRAEREATLDYLSESLAYQEAVAAWKALVGADE